MITSNISVGSPVVSMTNDVLLPTEDWYSPRPVALTPPRSWTGTSIGHPGNRDGKIRFWNKVANYTLKNGDLILSCYEVLQKVHLKHRRHCIWRVAYVWRSILAYTPPRRDCCRWVPWACAWRRYPPLWWRPTTLQIQLLGYRLKMTNINNYFSIEPRCFL